MSRTLEQMFGKTRDGRDPPIPYPDSARELSAAIYALCHLAATEKGDGVVCLSLLHSASLLVEELRERMEPYRNWIPPLPELPWLVPPPGAKPEAPKP